MPQDGAGLPPGGQGPSLQQDEPQIHVSGIFIVLLEVALIIENSLPILVVISWLPSCARGVGDRLIAAFSITCIMSALIPTPLGLASYFSGSWYGGSPTCNTYQVTSIWCNLSALALLSYICVNCHFAVSRLLGFRIEAHNVGDSSQHHQKLLSTSVDVDHDSLSNSIHQNMLQTKEETDDDVMLEAHCEGLKRQKQCASIAGEDCNIQMCPSEHITVDNENLSIQTNDNSHSSEHEVSNTVQTDFDDNKSLPGDTDSSFQTSKLEFLTDNAQSMSTVLIKRDSNYDGDIRNEVLLNGHVGKDLYSELKDSGEEDMFRGHRLSDAKLPPSSQNRQENSSLQNTQCYQDVTSVLLQQYDTLCRHNSQNDTSFSHKFQNHIDVTQTDNLVYEDSTFLYTNSLETHLKHHYDDSGNNNQSTKSRMFQARDHVSIALFFLFSVTLTISSLPVVGFGPQHEPVKKLCSSWLVPTPESQRQRVFFIAFLTCVYSCLVLGCITAARVCFLVNRRIKQEVRRSTRLYHQENIPDIREFSVIDDLKRHYSLTCLAVCGVLTWLPIAIMLTLQKSGVQVSEATLVYANIATSLPCLLNPLLYSLVLARYREGYKAILEKCCRRRNTQGPHQMRSVRNCRQGTVVDADMVSNSSGHQCVHGRANPTFESYAGFDIDEDIIEGDDDDENEDGDFDHYFHNGQNGHAKNTLIVKLSEKTPLQSSSQPASKHGKSPDVRSVGLVNKRHWPFPTAQSNDDEECLITNERRRHENETGV